MLLTAALCTSRATHAQIPGQDAESPSDDGRGRDGIPGGHLIRGIVSVVSGDHFTVKQEDGQSIQVVITANTRITRQRQNVRVSDLKPGDGVGAAGVLDIPTKTLHALIVFAVNAEDIRKAQQNLGKTYITGKITLIDDVRLTVVRPDGVAQVIEVDEGTSFRKGGRGGMGTYMGVPPSAAPERSGTALGAGPARDGESITLSDIKVGDNVFATGALKNSVFHPTELRVASPRRRREATSDANAPAAARP